MIGKIYYNLLIITLFFCLDIACADESLSNTEKFIGEIKALPGEDFLYGEQGFDNTFKSLILKKHQECLDTEHLLSSQIDQGVCFNNIKDYQLKYLDLKYKIKNKVLLDGYGRIRNNLRILHEEKIKEIQRHNPGDDPIFGF